MKKELMFVGTYFKKDGVNVIQTTPNGVNHTIASNDLDNIAAALGADGYEFEWNGDCSKITVKALPNAK